MSTQDAAGNDAGLQGLLAQLDTALFEIDSEGRTVYLSEPWRRWTGAELSAALGRDLADFLHPADQDGHRARIHAILSGQRDHCQHEVRLPARDGEPRWLEVQAKAFRDAGGSRRIAGTLTDMTVRRGMEDALRDSAYRADEARADAESALLLLRSEYQELATERDEALAAHRSASEFVASMAHDLRTPLNGVLGMTETLLHSSLDAAQREQALIVRSSGEAVQRLIEDIVEFSRVCTGGAEVEARDFALRPLVEELARLFGQKALVRGIPFRASVSQAVPDPFHGPESHLRQLVTHLASSAMRFTDQGEVSLFVERRAAHDSNGRVPLRIEIRDSDPEQRMLRLSRNDRHAGLAQPSGAAGMGLAVAHRLATLLGGTLRVEAEQGRGCVTILEFELERARAAARTPHAPEFHLKVAPLHLRVLVAEDNTVNQKVTLRLLERFGLKADLVSDGQSAVEAVEANAYDVVLMDVLMPRLSGLQATQAIREREHVTGRHTPIIAMTAHALSGDRDRCLEAGMDGFVSKPIQADVLYEELANWDPNAVRDEERPAA